jgi:hypothetical protein
MARLTDADALDLIAGLLNGRKWTARDCKMIANIVRKTGRLVRTSEGGGSLTAQ